MSDRDTTLELALSPPSSRFFSVHEQAKLQYKSANNANMRSSASTRSHHCIFCMGIVVQLSSTNSLLVRHVNFSYTQVGKVDLQRTLAGFGKLSSSTPFSHSPSGAAKLSGNKDCTVRLHTIAEQCPLLPTAHAGHSSLFRGCS